MEKASNKNYFHYNRRLQGFAKVNKKTLTKSATYTWKYLLSKRQMKGYKFRRERPVLNYIADFVCLELMLIIEIDGITHQSEEAQARDKKRDEELGKAGFTVLRFNSLVVLKRMDDVAIAIGNWIDENAKVPPPPPRVSRRKTSPPSEGEK